MKMRSVVPMRVAKIGYMIVSAVFCIVGILMIAMPDVFIHMLGTILGIAITVFGVVKLVGYFSKDLYRLAFQYDLQFGILLLALGIILLVRPGNVLHFICIALGICIMIDGLFKIKNAKESRTFGIKSWWVTMALAVFSCIAGLLLVFRPSESAATLVVLLGASLLVEGILNFNVAISMVKIVKNQMPDVIEVDYYETQDPSDR